MHHTWQNVEIATFKIHVFLFTFALVSYFLINNDKFAFFSLCYYIFYPVLIEYDTLSMHFILKAKLI